jgi:hypothetical protein
VTSFQSNPVSFQRTARYSGAQGYLLGRVGQIIGLSGVAWLTSGVMDVYTFAGTGFPVEHIFVGAVLARESVASWGQE